MRLEDLQVFSVLAETGNLRAPPPARSRPHPVGRDEGVYIAWRRNSVYRWSSAGLRGVTLSAAGGCSTEQCRCEHGAQT